MEAAVCGGVALAGSSGGAATGSRSTFSGSCFSGGSGAVWAGTCATTGPVMQSRIIGRTNSQLLQGRIVSGTSMNGKLGQPFGRNQLYLQFTPLPVSFNILGPISQHVLVT